MIIDYNEEDQVIIAHESQNLNTIIQIKSNSKVDSCIDLIDTRLKLTQEMMDLKNDLHTLNNRGHDPNISKSLELLIKSIKEMQKSSLNDIYTKNIKVTEEV